MLQILTSVQVLDQKIMDPRTVALKTDSDGGMKVPRSVLEIL
jgi:hypothetical protein